jgi:hypothetical protein
VETLAELMARLNHLERLATDEHDIVLFQALLHAELPRISKAVAALIDGMKIIARGKRVKIGNKIYEQPSEFFARDLLARLDKEEPKP